MASSLPRPVRITTVDLRWSGCALNWPALGRRLGASPQQIEIVQLLVTEDLTAERMAIRLGTTPSAINTQLDRLRTKLGVHSRAAIVVRMWQAWLEMEGERCNK